MRTLRIASIAICLANALAWGLYSGRPLTAVAWLLLAAACPRLIKGGMMATTRLYRIDPQESALALDVPAAHAASTRLVEAATSSQALRHVAKGQYLVTVPNTKEVAALMAKGATVEVAGAE